MSQSRFHAWLLALCANIECPHIRQYCGIYLKSCLFQGNQVIAIRLPNRHDSLQQEVTQINTIWKKKLRNGFASALSVPHYYTGIGWGYLPITPAVWEKFFHEIQTQFEKNRPLIFTGHSLGAAISLALAQRLFTQGYAVAEWVGFGCPKVFLGRRQWGTVKLTSYRNGNDRVASCHPAGLWFHHPVRLTNIGSPIYAENNWLDHAIENYLLAFLNNSGWPR